jgi:transcription elongation factor Elf1
MAMPERPAGPGVLQCPSCGSTAVLSATVESGTVWLVCRHCDLRWSSPDRRSQIVTVYKGPERRGRLFDVTE